MSQTKPLGLFEAFGVELEYMIVDATSLDVRPITDRVLHDVAGEYLSEIEMGNIAWSNELALHVIELKTNGPANALHGLAVEFQTHVGKINAILKPMGAKLMPTAMHPWMNPFEELKLWPHEYNPVYEAYNRIFDCRGHGWANLQSVHLNLPFANDEEFGKLHAAIRLLLPILPAMSASSPVMDRQSNGVQDNRLEVYRNNSRRIPSLTAEVIPEPVFSLTDYEREIFQPMYRDISPLDAEGMLQHEWLNSRGAIARWDRQTIEIRVLDVQECPAADLAICELITSILKQLCAERWTSVAAQQAMATAPLAAMFLDVVRDADAAWIEDADFLAQFGITSRRVRAGDLWLQLIESLTDLSPAASGALSVILRQGPLSRRIERTLAGDLEQLPQTYAALCTCLSVGCMFLAEEVG